MRRTRGQLLICCFNLPLGRSWPKATGCSPSFCSPSLTSSPLWPSTSLTPIFLPLPLLTTSFQETPPSSSLSEASATHLAGCLVAGSQINTGPQNHSTSLWLGSQQLLSPPSSSPTASPTGPSSSTSASSAS